MARYTESWPALDVAALDAVCSISARSLTDGTSETVTVSREAINRLRYEINDKYPGAIDRVYLNRREAS